MQKIPLAPFMFLAVLTAIVVAFWAIGFLKERRLRALRCPRCQRHFDVPDLARVKQWMEMDMAKGKVRASGVTLHCATCAADFRFTEALEPVDRA